MPLVSIIVPMYRVESYIIRCLHSLTSQTYQNIEIICIDDGSPDASGSLAENYPDHRIHVIHQHNIGLGLSRNVGIHAAHGIYLMFVDADDFISPDFVESLVNQATQTHSNTAIAGYSRFYPNRIIRIENPLFHSILSESDVKDQLLYCFFGPLPIDKSTVNVAVWRILYSAELIQKHTIRFPSERKFISEDIIFNINYFSHCSRVCNIENTGYYYCQNPDSLTEKYLSDRFDKGKTLYYEKQRLAESLNCLQHVQERLETSFLQYSRYSLKLEIKYSRINSLYTTLKNLRRISQDSLLQSILYKHKSTALRPSDKFIDFLLRHHCVFVIYLFLRIIYTVTHKLK